MLQTYHNRACQLCHNYQFTENNILFMHYHQNNSCSDSNEMFIPSQWTNMQVLFELSTGFIRQSFSCLTCLGYESEVSHIHLCDLKRRSFFFGHINTTFLQVTDDVHFCWTSNCEDCTGEMVWILFNWTDLNEIENLNCNYESILIIGSFFTWTHPMHGNEAKKLK